MKTISREQIKDGVMIEIIGEIKDNFSFVPNKIWSDEELGLSFLARALLTKLITLPPRWKIYWEQVARQMEISPTKLRKIVNELIDNGLLETFRIKNEAGEFEKGVYAKINLEYFLTPKRENDDKEISLQDNINSLDLLEKDETKELKNITQDNHLKLDFSESKDEQKQDENTQTAKLYPHDRKSTCGFLNSYKYNKILNKDPNIFLSEQELLHLKSNGLIKTNNALFFEITQILKKQRPQVAKLAEPMGLSDDEQASFKDFIAYRVEKNRNRKLTNATQNALIKHFETLKAQGIDIIQAVNACIQKGWSIPYAPNPPRQSHYNTNYTPKAKESALQRLERIKREGIFAESRQKACNAL